MQKQTPSVKLRISKIVILLLTLVLLGLTGLSKANYVSAHLACWNNSANECVLGNPDVPAQGCGDSACTCIAFSFPYGNCWRCEYSDQGCGAYGCPSDTKRLCQNCSGTWSCQCVADASCVSTPPPPSSSSAPTPTPTASATPTPTPIPTPTPPPYSGYYFDLKGPGGFPGIPACGGTTNLTQANVSETGWLANSSYNASKIYDSNYFVNAIPEGTVINSLPSIVNTSILNAGSIDLTTGVYWYEYDPDSYSGADLTINTSSLGSKKFVIISNGANVNIKGDITLTKGSGFLLLVAAANVDLNGVKTKGDIIIDPGVGYNPAGVTEATPANIEGVFVADGQFHTGTTGSSSDLQLRVRGSIATYGGMNLQRDLGAANATTPAEFFEFGPDLVLLFPQTLGARTMNWQEVAP